MGRTTASVAITNETSRNRLTPTHGSVAFIVYLRAPNTPQASRCYYSQLCHLVLTICHPHLHCIALCAAVAYALRAAVCGHCGCFPASWPGWRRLAGAG